MKTIFKYIFLLPALMLATSCEKDNYEEPEAGIFGQVYDHHGKPGSHRTRQYVYPYR